MDDFYEKMAENEAYGSAVACTVLTGPHAGEHCVFGKEGKKKEGDAFPLSMAPYLLEVSETSVVSAGDCRILAEIPGRRESMVICGCGHVAQNVLRLAKIIGFAVTVIDDRPEFADEARRIGADRVICDSFTHALKQIPGDTETFFVIMTRGHRYDMDCLKETIEKPHAYLGMMGSRGRCAAVKAELNRQGAKETLINELHAPIGLSIGAETPEEIAVSVIAEVIAVLHADKRKENIQPEEILSAACDGKRKVMAVITERNGSAPRKAGTRMAVYEDGSICGTIGGGCMEAEVIRKALFLMRSEKRTDYITLDMTLSGMPEEDAMACGGRIRVFLEIIA